MNEKTMLSSYNDAGFFTRRSSLVQKPRKSGSQLKTEISQIKQILNANFDFKIKSVEKFADENGKFSIIFSSNLPDTLTPQEISKINDKAFKIVDLKGYKKIGAIAII